MKNREAKFICIIYSFIESQCLYKKYNIYKIYYKYSKRQRQYILICPNPRGVYFLSFILQKYGLLIGWGENMMIHKEEKKRKKGEVLEKRGKRGNLYFTRVKKYHFGKRGGGKNIIF